MFEDQNLAWFLTLVDYDISRRELCLSNVHCADYAGVGEDCLNHLHCSPGSTEDEFCDWTPVSLRVGTTADGKAAVSWGIPDTKAEEEGLTVALFKNDNSSSALVEKAVDGLTSGSFPTDISLNAGLQVRLVLKGEKQEETLWRGAELDDANRKRPVKIMSTDASMQLFTRDGLAYIRLYVKKSFTNWQNSFPSDWVGYHQAKGGSYVTWVYLNSLVQTTAHKFEGYDVYEHFFNQTITPEASLQLYNAGNRVTTQTIPWDE
ncbi:hypothetical protein ACEWY4_018942 [Coilia grayii]|uniref:Uncharacterized protein n=1 Tax=Coilia grayii TaxID=363190 RepID=A0ABD1JEQ1_9TELE